MKKIYVKFGDALNSLALLSKKKINKRSSVKSNHKYKKIYTYSMK